MAPAADPCISGGGSWRWPTAIGDDAIEYGVDHALKFLIGVAIHPKISTKRIADGTWRLSGKLREQPRSARSTQRLGTFEVMRPHREQQLGAANDGWNKGARPMIAKVETVLERDEQCAIGGRRVGPRLRTGTTNGQMRTGPISNHTPSDHLGERTATRIAGTDKQQMHMMCAPQRRLGITYEIRHALAQLDCRENPRSYHARAATGTVHHGG
jgi:hypothetical protein